MYIQCFIIYDNAAKVVAWYHAGIVKPDVYCVKLKLCHSHQIKKKKPWLQKLNSTENAFTPTSVLNTFQENPHPVRSSGLNPAGIIMATTVNIAIAITKVIAVMEVIMKNSSQKDQKKIFF